MTSQEVFLSKLARRLEEARVPYMVTGSTASVVYGEPRATRDVDLVIDPSPAELETFLSTLQADTYVSREAAREALVERGMFNIVDLDSGWKADLIFRKERPFSREEFSRRVRADVLGLSLWVLSPEDSLLSKLEWAKAGASDLQLRDAASIVKLLGETLDGSYLARWAAELGLSDLLAQLLEHKTQP